MGYRMSGQQQDKDRETDRYTNPANPGKATRIEGSETNRNVDVRRYVLDDVDTQHHTNRNTVKQGAAFEYLPREICTHRAHGYVQAGILSVRTGLHGLH